MGKRNAHMHCRLHIVALDLPPCVWGINLFMFRLIRHWLWQITATLKGRLMMIYRLWSSKPLCGFSEGLSWLQSLSAVGHLLCCNVPAVQLLLLPSLAFFLPLKNSSPANLSSSLYPRFPSQETVLWGITVLPLRHSACWELVSTTHSLNIALV